MKSIHFDIVHIPIPRLLSQHLYRIEKVWFHIIPIETKSVLYRVHPMKLVRSNISIEWRISTSICWNIICYQNLIISIEYKYFVYRISWTINSIWTISSGIFERKSIIRIFKQLEIFILLWSIIYLWLSIYIYRY